TRRGFTQMDADHDPRPSVFICGSTNSHRPLLNSPLCARSNSHTLGGPMLRRRLNCLPLLLALAFAFSLAAQTARHPIRLDDLTRFRNVGDPQISPDGQWVAYVVGITDAKEDKSSSHIWMVNIDGSNDRQITFSSESEGSPRFSP